MTLAGAGSDGSTCLAHGVHALIALCLALPGCGPRDSLPDGGYPGRDGGAGEGQEGDGHLRCIPFQGLAGEDLRQALFEAVDGHAVLEYDQAREVIFSELDNLGGRVQCVYTGEWVASEGIPPAALMNTEHSWCQSWGADTLPAKSDLNHLYPALSPVNSRRSNHPFGDVARASWSQGGSALGSDAAGRTVFEPRDVHKGDCARAMFYFAVRYRMEMDDAMEDALRRWNLRDPPDGKEIERAELIERIQLRRNPLVGCPALVEEIPDF